MFIQFLGTGAGQPSKSRNVSSLALKLLDELNEIWLFDCGEGTQNRILETAIRPRKISKIFITHLHGDHIFGLPGFLSSRSFQSSDEQTDIDIYGPVGIKSFVLTSLKVSGTRLPYRIHFHEFDEKSLGLIFENDKFKVYADKLDHTTFCVGFRVIQKDLEGTLNAEKLKAAGVQFGPLFGKIKNGENVVLEDGKEALEPTAYTYLVNDHWSPDAQYSFVNLADPTLGIDWPIPLDQCVFSEKDRNHPPLAQAIPVAQKKILITGGGGQLATALKQLLPQAEVATKAELDICTDLHATRKWRDYSTIINTAAYTAVDAAELLQLFLL